MKKATKKYRRHIEPTDSVQAEQTELLYSNLPASICINSLLALTLTSVQGQILPKSLLLYWLSALALILLGRALLFISWKHSKSKLQNNSYHWLIRFRIGVIATGIMWGIGAILMSPTESFLHQLFVAFTLVGLCAGAISALFIDRISVVGFVLPIIIPQITFFILQGGKIHISMSAMALLFLLYIAASARQAGKMMHENIRFRKKAAEDELRFRKILEFSPIATRIADKEKNQVIFANQSYIELIGVPADQVIGTDPTQYYVEPGDYVSILERLNKGEHIKNKLIELIDSNNKQKSKWVLASYIQIEYQNKPSILGWLYDITDRKQMEEEIQHIAYHDLLTGLPNRILLNDRLHQALSIAERENTTVALMFVDLDKFKPINDTYGHEVGDLMLEAVAGRISKCLRKSDSVARIGGDEFVVLLPGVENIEAALEVAEKIRKSLNQPFEIAELSLNISSSTGIAIYPDHTTKERQLINHADTAMYHAKKNGKNNVQLYNSGMKNIITKFN